MKQVYLNSYYHLIAEFILAFLLFQPIFGLIEVNNEIVYYIISFISSIVFVFIVSNRPSLFKLCLVSLILLALLVSIFLKLNIIIFAFLIGYVFYRTRVVILNELEDYSHLILFYTFCAGLVVITFNLFIKIDDVKDISFIVAGVFILQMFYCIVIGYFKKIMMHNIKENKSKFLLPLAGIVMALIMIVTSLYLLRDVFNRIFFGFIDIIFRLLKGILTPVLKLINIEFEDKSEPTEPYVGGFGEGQYEPEPMGEDNYHVFWIVFGIIIFIIIIIAGYVIYRYLRNKKEEFSIQKQLPIYEQTVKNLMGGISVFSKTKLPEPENKIRKEVYHLERFAFKKGVERKQGETIRQWFERLDLHMPELFFDYYEKVRYGQQLVDAKEQQQFLNYSKKVKELLKERIKGEKLK